MLYITPKITSNNNTLAAQKHINKTLKKHREEIIDVYTNGCATIRELSVYIKNKFKCSISIAPIHKFLHENNVYLRQDGPRYLTNKELELNICKDYLDSRDMKKVGKKYGLSHVTVSWIVRAYGIKTGFPRTGKRRIR